MGVFSFIGRFVDFLAPPLCPLCHRDLSQSETGICPECEGALPRLEERRCPGCGGNGDGLLAQCRDCLEMPERPWTVAVSAFPFTGAIRLAVHRLKYRGQRNLAPFFGKALGDAWRRFSNGFCPDVVTAVPLHWFRRWRRGYNQAEEVAQCLATALGIPYDGALLKRTRWTRPQASLDAKQRQKNLKRAFAVKGDVAGRRILLVDDVFTTGVTLSAAAEVLLKGRAREVAVASIAVNN